MKTLSEHTDQSNDSKKAVQKRKVKKKWLEKRARKLTGSAQHKT